MAIKKITISEFVALRPISMVFDVRSPSEFEQAHILGAQSLPLFTDEERKVVGTSYKQDSRESAVKIGLDFFGSKMRRIVEEVEDKMKNASSNKIIVHCWRGGMRSAGVAWLLDLYGFDISVLVGGYKAYRRWIHQHFSQEYNFWILSGNTGSGKTVVLQELNTIGKHTIDLEGLAKHRGSAFGGMEEPQPTQEMFENKLGEALAILGTNNKPIWVEDESQRIGNLNIPPAIWQTMRKAKLYFLEVPFEERLKHIVAEYGIIDKEELQNATKRIEKRLGGLETKNCLKHLEENNVEDAFRILLKYYDKQYLKAFNKRSITDTEIKKVICDKVDGKINAEKLIEWKKK